MHGDVGVHYVVGNARSVGRYVDDSVKMQVSMTLSVNCWSRLVAKTEGSTK